MTPVKQRSIRLDVEIDVRLVEYARRTRRTVNAAVNYLIGEALTAEPDRSRQEPGHRTGTSTLSDGA